MTILTLFMGCKNGFNSPKNEVITTVEEKKVDTIHLDTTQNKISPADIYAQAAIETCNCIQPMLEKAKHLKELEINKQTTDMKTVVREMSQIQPQVQKCSDEIREKYYKINKVIDEKRIKNALLAECPDMATLFSSLSKVKYK